MDGQPTDDPARRDESLADAIPRDSLEEAEKKGLAQRFRGDEERRYLDAVQGGGEVVITDRGTAIARLVPLHGERALDHLIREGRVTRAVSSSRRLPTPIAASGTVFDLVAGQRR